ncbi:MAG: hypothetical protein ACOC1K_03570 [Nanoarchaeota archaeon]
MEKYGYTPNEWQEINKQEKVLMIAKRQLEVERENRIREEMKSNN